jgi:AraC family transcriptional regulator
VTTSLGLLENLDAGITPAFVYNNVVELLETAKRELERDREAAKTSLATASSILQSEIERRSRTKGARPGALAAWQIARVRAFIDENLHRTIHVEDLSAVARRSTAHFSRSFNKPSENHRTLTW